MSRFIPSDLRILIRRCNPLKSFAELSAEINFPILRLFALAIRVVELHWGMILPKIARCNIYTFTNVEASVSSDPDSRSLAYFVCFF